MISLCRNVELNDAGVHRESNMKNLLHFTSRHNEWEKCEINWIVFLFRFHRILIKTTTTEYYDC